MDILGKAGTIKVNKDHTVVLTVLGIRLKIERVEKIKGR